MTRARHVLGALVMLGVAGLLAAQPVPPKDALVPPKAKKPVPPATAASAAAQEVVFFTPDGPVRVRLTVTIAGKRPAQTWRTAIDALFSLYDTNHDGNLNAEERNHLMFGTPPELQGVIVQGEGGASTSINQKWNDIRFPVKDGKVSRTDFRTEFLLVELGPISVNPISSRIDWQLLTDILFKRLDIDGDGTLSLTELRAARDRLTPLDIDEDEVLTIEEVLGRSLATSEQDDSQVITPNPTGQEQRSRPQLANVLVLPPGEPATPRVVLAFRDRNKDGTLTATELGCDARALAGLDTTGDGRLDANELAEWLRQPPDVDLAGDLADPWIGDSWLPVPRRAGALAPGRPLTAVGKGRLADHVKPGRDSRLALDQSGTRFRFTANHTLAANARQRWRTQVNGLRTAFAATAGGKDAVEQQQIQEKPEFEPTLLLFGAADRNGDGTLTRAELNRTVAAGNQTVNARVEITITDMGRGLFELLDTNGDFQLTPREIAAALGVLAVFDRNRDGKLDRSELPRGYTVTVAAASLNALSPPSEIDDASMADINGLMRLSIRGAPVTGVPEWFRNTDRNGDGDVSTREFPASPAVFRKIDTDGDGLISPEEARAYEKRSRRPN